jgi:hypothetical protein
MRLKDIAAKQQQEQEWSNNMSMGVPEVISKETNDMTAEQVLEFLEKCPLTIDVDIDIQTYWFRKPTTTTTISFLYKGQPLDASKFIKLNSK